MNISPGVGSCHDVGVKTAAFLANRRQHALIKFKKTQQEMSYTGLG
jgi:hypothetical protein